jgi:hypothetical protein
MAIFFLVETEENMFDTRTPTYLWEDPVQTAVSLESKTIAEPVTSW